MDTIALSVVWMLRSHELYALAVGGLHVDAQAPGPGVRGGERGGRHPPAAGVALHHVHRHRVLAADEARQELASWMKPMVCTDVTSASYRGVQVMLQCLQTTAIDLVMWF